MHLRALLVSGALFINGGAVAQETASWTDITNETGLEAYPSSRVKFADLNNDIWPDIVLLPETNDRQLPTVYLHNGISANSKVAQFEKQSTVTLPPVSRADTVVFADINNDGNQDAIIGRYLDIYQDDYEPPASPPSKTAWLPGLGNGYFDDPTLIETATLATTRAIAVGDVNIDGLPDLYLGNWYERYFTGYEAFSNDLLLQFKDPENRFSFVRWPMPTENSITSFETDLGGRPTYGVVLPRLDQGIPMLLELNYGRRWNRLFQMQLRTPLKELNSTETTPPKNPREPHAISQSLVLQLQGQDIAPMAGVDGDSIRHGIYPNWPRKNADGTTRPPRIDEAPFRSNGNTFDAAVGDIDNDGDFDLFLSTIIHAWAGDSSDHSRFLVSQLSESGTLTFKSPDFLNVDRIPEAPKPGEAVEEKHKTFNQGDIYAELADLNHDGLLDLILCSSDYPDPPPNDERLRIYHQQSNGRFKDVTQQLGLNHVGAGMPSLGDVDQDGDLDLLIGQSFNRLTAEQRTQAAIIAGTRSENKNPESRPRPSVRLFRNDSTEGRASLVLKLVGDPKQETAKEAYGAIVKVSADLDQNTDTPPVVQQRQVLGPYGHSGKQHLQHLHFGLGAAKQADKVEIHWPNGDKQVITSLRAGRHTIHQQSP